MGWGVVETLGKSVKRKDWWSAPTSHEFENNLSTENGDESAAALTLEIMSCTVSQYSAHTLGLDIADPTKLKSLFFLPSSESFRTYTVEFKSSIYRRTWFRHHLLAISSAKFILLSPYFFQTLGLDGVLTKFKSPFFALWASALGHKMLNLQAAVSDGELGFVFDPFHLIQFSFILIPFYYFKESFSTDRASMYYSFLSNSNSNLSNRQR